MTGLHFDYLCTRFGSRLSALASWRIAHHLQGILKECTLNDGLLQEGTLLEGTLRKEILEEGTLLEGTLLEASLQEGTLLTILAILRARRMGDTQARVGRESASEGPPLRYLGRL